MKSLLLVALIGAAVVWVARKVVVVAPEKFVLEHLRGLLSEEVGRDTAA